MKLPGRDDYWYLSLGCIAATSNELKPTTLQLPYVWVGWYVLCWVTSLYPVAIVGLTFSHSMLGELHSTVLPR